MSKIYSIFKEGDSFIAYSPTLDLSTSGNSFEQARSRFKETANIFFEEVSKKGTLKTTLKNLGISQNEYLEIIKSI